jgi:hypothetical protein
LLELILKRRRRMKRFAIITLTAAALTSCGSGTIDKDYLSEASTMTLCVAVLNGTGHGVWQEADELARRGEDCSNLMHLRRPVASDINVNVEQ